MGGIGEAYVQFQDFNGEVANFYNVAQGSSDGRYVLASRGIRLQASPQGRKTLVSVVLFTGPSASFKLVYYLN